MYIGRILPTVWNTGRNIDEIGGMFLKFAIATNLLSYIVRCKQTADSVHDDADM